MKHDSGYDNISELYRSAYRKICADDEIKSGLKRVHVKKRTRSYAYAVRSAGAAAAAVCLLFTGLVNVSPVFAAGAESMPVIGMLAELVNFRSYSEETEDYAVSVSVPAVIEGGSGNDGISDDLNAEMLKLCEQYASDAKARALEYREAFLETGGTEEEWKEHDITITVDYEIKSVSSEYLSFVIYGYESWLSSEASAYYYNLDVRSMKDITLEDMLGEDYADIADRQIRQQIKERQEKGSGEFFTQEEGGFESITEEQNFYINSAGNPVIVFEKYAIAPGSMGEVEFEISR